MQTMNMTVTDCTISTYIVQTVQIHTVVVYCAVWQIIDEIVLKYIELYPSMYCSHILENMIYSGPCY